MLQNGDLQMRNFINVIIFLLGLFILVSPVSAKDIYYCAVDEATGFAPVENYKRYKYENKRFNLEVDFENQSMKSKKIHLKDRVTCELDTFGNVLYCLSQYGVALALHKKTLKFHYSHNFLVQDQEDDVYLTHGSCEKF